MTRTGRRWTAPTTSWAKRAFALLLITTLSSVAAGLSPAVAALSDWPAPLVLDRCGTSQDRVYVQNNPPNSGYSMSDTTGRGYTSGMYHSTNGVASITFILTDYGVEGAPTYTYPPVHFGTEADSTCVEAADTVTFSDPVCNASTNGTAVTFTYINVDDSTDRSHTTPYADVVRWDGGQSARVIFAVGPVADGQQLTRRGGDDPSGYQGNFFLAPGTYKLTLTTEEKGEVRLPNRLFVPSCGKYTVPPNDPSGLGATPSSSSVQPTGKLRQTSATKMRMTASNVGLDSPTAFRLSINPKRGATANNQFTVPKGATTRKTLTSVRGTAFTLKAKVKQGTSWRWIVLKRASLR